jgi:hypothetical protein
LSDIACVSRSENVILYCSPPMQIKADPKGKLEFFEAAQSPAPAE